MWRRGAAIAVGLSVLLWTVPAGGAVLVPIAHQSSNGDATVYHGVAHPSSNDTWTPGGCGAAVTVHTLNLSIPAVHGAAGEPELKIWAEHYSEGFEEITVREAVATPGEPAEITVRQGCTAPYFTVAAVDVLLPTKYRVEGTYEI